MIQVAQAQYEKAKRTLEAAAKLAPLNPLVMFQYATVLNKLGHNVGQILAGYGAMFFATRSFALGTEAGGRAGGSA